MPCQALAIREGLPPFPFLQGKAAWDIFLFSFIVSVKDSDRM
jgi:hypothetical protein